MAQGVSIEPKYGQWRQSFGRELEERAAIFRVQQPGTVPGQTETIRLEADIGHAPRIGHHLGINIVGMGATLACQAQAALDILDAQLPDSLCHSGAEKCPVWRRYSAHSRDGLVLGTVHGMSCACAWRECP